MKLFIYFFGKITKKCSTGVASIILVSIVPVSYLTRMMGVDGNDRELKCGPLKKGIGF